MPKDCGAIILAAGKSTRMGYPKLMLKTNEGNFFWQYLVQKFFEFGCDTVLVVNSKGFMLIKKYLWEYPSLKIVINDYDERCVSIIKGLQNLQKNYVFIQNVDNLSVDYQLLKTLYQNREKGDYIVPIYANKGGHPILINKKIIETLQNFAYNCKNFRNLLQQFNRFNVITLNEKILQNINTQADYLNFLKQKK